MKTITIREDFLINLLKEEWEAASQNCPGIHMQKDPMEWVESALARMQERLEKDLQWVEGTTLSTRACLVIRIGQIRSEKELAVRIGELEDSDYVSTNVLTELKDWLQNLPEGFGPTPQQEKEFADIPPFITQALARNGVGLNELIRMDSQAVIRLPGIGNKARTYLLETGLLRKR